MTLLRRRSMIENRGGTSISLDGYWSGSGWWASIENGVLQIHSDGDYGGHHPTEDGAIYLPLPAGATLSVTSPARTEMTKNDTFGMGLSGATPEWGNCKIRVNDGISASFMSYKNKTSQEQIFSWLSFKKHWKGTKTVNLALAIDGVQVYPT